MRDSSGLFRRKRRIDEAAKPFAATGAGVGYVGDFCAGSAHYTVISRSIIGSGVLELHKKLESKTDTHLEHGGLEDTRCGEEFLECQSVKYVDTELGLEPGPKKPITPVLGARGRGGRLLGTGQPSSIVGFLALVDD